MKNNNNKNHRMEDYLDVITTETTEMELLIPLATSLIQTSSNILASSPKDELNDEMYVLIENLESVLLCGLRCGEESIEIQVIISYFPCACSPSFGL